MDIKVVPAEPAYEGALYAGNGVTTFNYVWHQWDLADNPKYRMPYTSNEYPCCSNPGAGATPHLGAFTPTAQFRMRYDGVKWVNRVAFTVLGGQAPEPPEPPLPDPCPNVTRSKVSLGSSASWKQRWL